MTSIFSRPGAPGVRRPSRTTNPGRSAPGFDSLAPLAGPPRLTPPGPEAVVISDRPDVASRLRGLLGDLGYSVRVMAGPERPWHAAAARSEPVVVVDLPNHPMPEGAGLNLSRCIAVRPRRAGPEYDRHAQDLGVRSVLGTRTALEELKALLGDPDASEPDTAETLPSLTDEEVESVLGAEPPTGEHFTPFRVGRRLQDRFLLLEQLPQGGRFSFRALDERRLVDVVVTLHMESKGTGRAFLDDARKVARLEHPNIARHVTAGVAQSVPFTVNEYAPGQTLAKMLERNGGPLEIVTSARIGRQVASALDVAHRRRVTHGALTPQAVLLVGRGAVRLTGLGAPRPSDRALRDGTRPMAPRDGSYCAPERFRNEAGPGYAADAWALGVLLYEMLAGFVPFRGRTLQEVRTGVLSGRASSLLSLRPAVPDGLAGAVELLLHPDPDGRPKDLRGIAERLFAVESSAQRLAWNPPADG